MGVLLAAVIYAGSARAQASCAQGSSVYVVAHADDSILFQNPTLEQDIGSGRCVETIIVTAGDDGQGSSYWMGREAGVKAAYAQMAGVPNTWTQADAGIAGHPMPRVTLTGEATVSLVFMRIPDGNLDGSGFASTGFTSLQKLWQGTIPTIAVIDGSSSYTTGDRSTH
jgi:GlcNAc-PI de-N-acetylase